MLRARRIATQLESYRSSHGDYSMRLSELGIDERKTGIYYELDFAESPAVDYLWFGTGFGTVSQYDSKTRTWHGPQ